MSEHTPERSQDPEAQTRLERQATLEQKLKLVDSFITDYGDDERGREVGVDSEMREFVATLLSLGVNTESSCWGHPERRSGGNDLPEHNLLPYVEVSGFKPGDGANNEGKAVGYTRAEVEAACNEARVQHGRQQKLLENFYRQHGEKAPLIKLDYMGDMPVFHLETVGKREIDDLDRTQQDELIAAAQKQWRDFFTFVTSQYLTGQIQ